MIGRSFGPYTILDRLGAGGMGAVYRARDETLHREVAIKVLPAEQLATHEARARLLREARLASSLNHPNICVIHQVGEQDGEMYIAMELIAGRPLREAIPAGGLPVSDVLRLGSQVADALAHAHGRHVIHRDLKSLNVMVTPEGLVKVLDFGLARAMASEDATTIARSRLTQTGTIVGSVHSMSPEVLRGEEADTRSDIWALGVLLHEMASGAPPFGGDTHFEVAAAILHGEPAALPERVPAGLRELIAKCLAKEPAQRCQTAAEARAALQALSSAGAPVAAPAIAALPRQKRMRRPLALWGGAAIALVAAVLLFGQYRGCPGAAARIRSLAVLPLENLSGDPSQQYFADGMTDELITDLAGIGMLRVIAHGSVMAYRSTRKPLSQIARELGVDALVEGSVSRSGDRVRIRADLARARTGESIWAESFERNLRDVLSMQTEVARSIAGKIQVRLEPPERQRLSQARPVDPAVLQAYLKGRFAWNRYTLDGFQEAERQFQAALDGDPTYAPAWAGLADAAYGMSSIYVAPEVALPRARAAAEKSLSLDSTLAEPNVSIGIVKMVYDWDWDGARRSFDRAIELKPSSANAHWWRSHLSLERGQFAESQKEEKVALQLDPLSSWYVANQGWSLIFGRQYAEAESLLRANLALYPNDYFFHVFLGLALSHEGKADEAVREMEKAVSADENNDDLGQLAYVYGVAGRAIDARRILDRLKERRTKMFVASASLALGYAGLHDEAETLRWLEAGVQDKSEMVGVLAVEPSFDFLRQNPRFQALIRRVGLADVHVTKG